MNRILLFTFTLAVMIFSFGSCNLVTISYAVTYRGNGSTAGIIATDKYTYQNSDIVTVLPKGTLVNEGYIFTGWNTQEDGLGTDRAPGSTFQMGSIDVVLYAQWETKYKVKDIGPAGGIIFYVDHINEYDWDCLEVAPYGWYNDDRDPVFRPGMTNLLTGLLIGSGESNTSKIVSYMYNDESIAAKVCSDAIIGAFDDWFLPSKEELSQIFQNLFLAGIGGFRANMYWSSSTLGQNTWAQQFLYRLEETPELQSWTSEYYVRPIRSF